METNNQPTGLKALFAENDTTKTTEFPDMEIAGSNQMTFDKGIPQICSLSIPNGGRPLKRDDLNGFAYLVSQYLMFMQVGGQFTFNADVSTAIGGYPLGALLYADASILPSGAAFVRSLKANNTDDFTLNPGYIGNGTSWEIAIGGGVSGVADYAKTLLMNDLSNISELGKAEINKFITPDYTYTPPVTVTIPTGGVESNDYTFTEAGMIVLTGGLPNDSVLKINSLTLISSSSGLSVGYQLYVSAGDVLKVVIGTALAADETVSFNFYKYKR